MDLLIGRPVVLLVFSYVALWLSAYFGAWTRRRRPALPDDRDDYSLILGATLTLLGLLVGFTFSMAVGRYDLRKNYEEEEANAIGTEYLRVDLLPQTDAAKARELLREYLALRLEYFTSIDVERMEQNNAATTALQSRLWAAVRPDTTTQRDPIRVLVLSGMNDVINRQGYSHAAFLNRVPIEAWLLVFLIAMFCNMLLGYRLVRNSRLISLTLPVALSISFFLIADIDSPRRGVIRIHPQNLEALAAALRH